MIFRIDRSHGYSPIDVLTLRGDGNVGIGTSSPISWSELDIYDGSEDAYIRIRGVGSSYQFSGINLSSDEATDKQWEIVHRKISGELNDLLFTFNNGSSWNDYLTIKPTGEVGIGTKTPSSKLDVNGTTRTKVLEITGGTDLAELFDIAPTEYIEPGMIVGIDPNTVGQLQISNKPYDRSVVGIISGGGGLRPGMLMSQLGSEFDGKYPVALSGRVYCLVDAANGPIEPGDFLTSSSIPGYGMKVTDYKRSQGSVIGKAMSALPEGKGLVLILVTLQ